MTEAEEVTGEVEVAEEVDPRWATVWWLLGAGVPLGILALAVLGDGWRRLFSAALSAVSMFMILRATYLRGRIHEFAAIECDCGDEEEPVPQ